MPSNCRVFEVILDTQSQKAYSYAVCKSILDTKLRVSTFYSFKHGSTMQ